MSSLLPMPLGCANAAHVECGSMREGSGDLTHLEVLLLKAAKAFLVIAPALVFIAEDAVGCGQLPELLSRCFSMSTLVLVWVIGQG